MSVALRRRQLQLTKQLKAGRRDKAGAAAIRRQLDGVKEQVEHYWDHLFIWRTIGDAIAFLYLDKFSNLLEDNRPLSVLGLSWQVV